ncbi:PadR family transcriptional regulator [Sporosarcina soli]|uniref:PadR family transcriptional regulator n=1 Tax=Sporosarcina soli TaxID=334736 RepID=A0ABW0TE13_9BACL
MDERLKRLRNSMDTTTFSQLNFTEQHRGKIREKISKENDREEDVLFAVMQLLVQEKTGFELVQLLCGRGLRTFEDNEGNLYALLHELEQEGCLHASWNESNVKYYQLSNKGRRRLRTAEKQSTSKLFAFNKLVGEGE